MDIDLIKKYITNVDAELFPPYIKKFLFAEAQKWSLTNETVLLEDKERLQNEIAEKQKQISDIDSAIQTIVSKIK